MVINSMQDRQLAFTNTLHPPLVPSVFTLRLSYTVTPFQHSQIPITALRYLPVCFGRWTKPYFRNNFLQALLILEAHIFRKNKHQFWSKLGLSLCDREKVIAGCSSVRIFYCVAAVLFNITVCSCATLSLKIHNVPSWIWGYRMFSHETNVS